MLCAFTLLFCGCDEIDYTDRFVEISPVTSTSKNVLIEEFTGQNCINCPKAARKVETLQSIYGKNRIIAVAIHGGSMAYSEEKYPNVGLANATGELYNTHWEVETWPAGIINRKSGINSDIEQWQGLAEAGLHEEPGVDITISTTYDEATRQAIVNTDIKMLKAGSAKLQLWVVENDIQTYQVGQTDYVHHHVFRAAINGDWGEEISTETDCCALNFSHKFTAKENWNADNLSVVAFVYNETDGVLQVTEKEI